MSKAKEERFNFKRILNIPVHIKNGDIHPTLNENVYKGADFQLLAQLYHDIQKTATDSSEDFERKISEIHNRLEELETEIIALTKLHISKHEQDDGKLITRTPEHAKILNESSLAFFTLINDICRKVGLSSTTRVISSHLTDSKKQKLSTEKYMLTNTSFAVAKQLDDALKRAKSTSQRIAITKKSIISSRIRHQAQYTTSKSANGKKWRILRNIRKLAQQQTLLHESINQTIAICTELSQERLNHITAIEHARNKKLYDIDNTFIDVVINNQGRKEYDEFITNLKNDIHGNDISADLTGQTNTKKDKLQLLQKQLEKWILIMESFSDTETSSPSRENIKHWYHISIRASRATRNIIGTLQRVRQQEWIHSKNHLIRIGKFGMVAKMINPKPKSGPTAGKFYPSKLNEPPRYAIMIKNDKKLVCLHIKCG